MRGQLLERLSVVLRGCIPGEANHVRRAPLCNPVPEPGASSRSLGNARCTELPSPLAEEVAVTPLSLRQQPPRRPQSLPLTRLDCSNKRPLEPLRAISLTCRASVSMRTSVSNLRMPPTQYTGFTWRPGLVPTRRHWPPSCLICRRSLRQRSVSSSPSRDDRRVRGGSRANSRCERPDCLSRGRDGRVGIWRHFGSLSTADPRSQIVEVTLRAWR